MILLGDSFHSETTPEEQLKNPKAWMCRPCEWYKDEGRECRRIRARIHQYFIFGETLDCSGWTRDYDTCMAFRQTRDPQMLDTLIASEELRFKERVQAALKNDVWKYRSSPPADWTAPLPEYMEQRTRGTLFQFYSKQQQQTLSDTQQKQ